MTYNAHTRVYIYSHKKYSLLTYIYLYIVMNGTTLNSAGGQRARWRRWGGGAGQITWVAGGAWKTVKIRRRDGTDMILVCIAKWDDASHTGSTFHFIPMHPLIVHIFRDLSWSTSLQVRRVTIWWGRRGALGQGVLRAQRTACVATCH